MKENTKFLWMYVGILFSFAIILIIFAGLSQNSDDAEKKGLKNDMIKVSEDNSALRKENSDLKLQLETITKENSTLISENDALKAAANSEKVIDDALLAASKAKDIGEYGKVKEILKPIDPLTLTEAQFYIYNSLVK